MPGLGGIVSTVGKQDEKDITRYRNKLEGPDLITKILQPDIYKFSKNESTSSIDTSIQCLNRLCARRCIYFL